MNPSERHAATWHDAMRRARDLDPERIAAHITASADTGLRAQRFGTVGSRSTFTPCREHETCDDGPAPHEHMVTNDPTGNAAVRGHRDAGTTDLRHLARAADDMVTHAAAVLDWVAGKHPTTWRDVLLTNAALQPGTIRAGLDVDDERHLPHHIAQVAKAVEQVEAIASDHQPRAATPDEQHWTAGLADEDCCAWHLRVHRRYRRPKVVLLHGQPICADCLALYDLADSTRPPDWVLEAEVDRLSKPKAWHAALGRWLDEVGVPRDRSA